jgi:hypothetical protein
MAMALVTVPNVPILEAGVEYMLSTGPTTFTPEDLRDAVTAANEDFSIPAPRAGIGHIDPRYNNTHEFDGTPAFGKYINLNLSENGMVVYADWVGCPQWLAEIGPAAFPGRSIEGYWNVTSQAGKTWRFVLSSCKSLGVVWPGVTVLEDLPLYYGEEMPPGVQVLDAEAVAASGQQPGGDPMSTQASANLDDVRRAFYNDYVNASNPDSLWWWIRAVLTDPNELIVEDDESGQLYKLPFSSDAKGAVSFGDPEAVRIDYVPDDRESQKAAASHVAAALAVNRKVMASWLTRAASRPDNPGGAMDPKEVRKALNLPEDATEEQVQQALLVKSGLVNAEGEQQEPPAPAAAPVVEVPAPAPAAVAPAAPAPAAVAPPEQKPEEQRLAASGMQLPPGTVLVDEGQWRATQEGLGRFNTFIEEQEVSDRQTLVSAAIGDGRVPPARRDHWLQYLEKDPEGGKAALAALSPNIVPLHERGHGITPEVSAAGGVPLEEETVQTWTHTLFPETRKTAASSSGDVPQHRRIASDGRYSRSGV